jgi:hypothetical protein
MQKLTAWLTDSRMVCGVPRLRRIARAYFSFTAVSQVQSGPRSPVGQPDTLSVREFKSNIFPRSRRTDGASALHRRWGLD